MKTITVGWFEIPVNDMDRAIAFYNAVFEVQIMKQDFGGAQMGWFPFSHEAKGAPGTLIKNNDHYKPSQDGALIYLSTININDELSRIATAGGEILIPKRQISEEHGYMAVFSDTEGNRIALHSVE